MNMTPATPVIRFVNWVLYTSLFASACAVALCMATERLLMSAIPHVFTALHLFIFGSSLVVYNVHYIIKRDGIQLSDRSAWTQRNRKWNITFLALGILLCLLLFPGLPPRVIYGCLFLAALSFAYSLPLLPFKNKRRLKDFGWIKIWILSGVWTMVTSVLPILFHGKLLSSYPFEILLRFVFMFILCIAFDIRDMQTDQDTGIYTLPSKIGLRATYRLIDFLILLFFALCFFQFLRYGSAIRLSGSIISGLLARIAISYARTYPSDKAYLVYVDGIMMVYAIMVLLH